MQSKENKDRPACGVPECEGRHTMRLHELLKDIYGERIQVNVVQGDDEWEDPESARVVDRAEGEDETVLVNTVRREGSSWRELDDSWLELNGGESVETGGVYCIGACLKEGGHAPGTEGGQHPGDGTSIRGGGGRRSRMVVPRPNGPAAWRGGDGVPH